MLASGLLIPGTATGLDSNDQHERLIGGSDD